MAYKRRKPTGRPGGANRRKAPPPATGREAEFLKAVKEARAHMIVQLVNGQRVEGVIEYFDRDMIKVTRPEGPHVFVRKEDIRYLFEEG
jgi:sRNA-binding regulator protein Hfq